MGGVAAAVGVTGLLPATGLPAAAATATPTTTAAPTTAPAAAPAITPTDAQTVPDPSQLTGRRVDLPLPDCTARPSDCNDVRLLNELDGFDVDPRIAVRFDRPVDLARVRRLVTLSATNGDPKRIGVERLVYDAASTTVFMYPDSQLAPATTYRVDVPRALTGGAASTTFTTYSTTRQLLQMRRQLDSGAAYDAAGIPAADRTVSFTPTAGGTRTVFPRSAIAKIERTDDRGAQDVTEAVPDLAFTGAGSYAFGSIASPSWLTPDRVIPNTPTRTGAPVVQGQERVGVLMVVPQGTPPAAGWPVAVFGHGFTRSKTDLLLAADFNASRGIATAAIDVVGHGYGPESTFTVTTATGPVTFPAYGRGIDQDGDGVIASTEGVSAPAQPHPLASIGSRDGLRQTVADNMALVRAIGRGVDVDGDGAADLRRDGVSYYGQSFGAIYGTMLGGVDPQVPVLVPNVGGGSITDISRLGAFRPLTAQALGGRQPSLLNGGPGLYGFTESIPLRLDPAVTDPYPGALAIQEVLARTEWIQRKGDPLAYVRLLRAAPPADSVAKKVIYQVAYGDTTVPNPTSANLMRTGGLRDVVSLYRNDKTPLAAQNPHGFLLSPTFAAARAEGQRQIVEFFASGGTRIIDPDGAGPVWEVPIRVPNTLERLNYPSPTGS